MGEAKRRKGQWDEAAAVERVMDEVFATLRRLDVPTSVEFNALLNVAAHYLNPTDEAKLEAYARTIADMLVRQALDIHAMLRSAGMEGMGLRQ
jgi:hypothetical protein